MATTVTFTNHDPSDRGDLSDSFNWDLDRLPGPGDIAVVTAEEGTAFHGSLQAQEIQFDAVSAILTDVQIDALSELRIEANTQFESGTITVNTGTQEGNFDVGGGTFTQTGGSVVSNSGVLVGRTGGDGGYLLTGGTLQASFETIAGPAAGFFQQSGTSTNTVDGVLTLDTPRAYTLLGGSLSAQGEAVGVAGIGGFSQVQGSNDIGGDLTLGIQQGSNGSYGLQGGTLAVAGNESIGVLGDGVFDQSGGENTVQAGIILGRSGGASVDNSGVYHLAGGAVSAQFETVGDVSAGQFAQSDDFGASTNTIAGTLTLGNQQGSSGIYQLTGGTLNVGTNIVVGFSGDGIFDQGGGQINVNGGVVLAVNEGANAQYHLHDGGTLSANFLTIGRAGQGELDITNGASAQIATDVKLGVQVNADTLKSNGSLEVAGTDSTLKIGGALNAGIDGSGHLSVQAGGAISASAVNMATNAGSNAEANITDTGSQVSVTGTGDFVIGAAGSAAVEVQNGASVTADRVLLATQTSGQGAADITGAGTVVHATHNSSEAGSGVVVGLGGHGAMQLSDGALLQSDWNMAVGGQSGSSGAVEQTGGTAIVHGTLTLAAFAGSSGSYQMTGGLLETDTAQINTNGELDVCGGVASIGNLVMNGGVFEICGSGGGAGGKVEIAHSATGGAITFGQGPGTLQIDDATNFHTAITNVQAGDTIDLANQQVVAESYDGSVLNLTFSNNQTASLLVSGDGVIQFDTISDGNGGSDVVFAGPGGGGGGAGNLPPLSIALANDTGVSATDLITKDATLTGIGEANAVLHFTVDGTAIATTATVDANGHWTFLPNGLADGTHTINVTESDGAGGLETAFLNFRLDTTPPSMSEMLANDSGVSSSDRITNDPSLTGTGDPNAIVHFTIDGTAISDTATADASGKWSFLPSGLSDGSHTIVASETDVAGNTGSASLGFTLDTTAPSATITGEATGKHGSFVLSGNADAGSTVNLFDGTTALGHVTAGANGHWSFTLASLSDALHTFTATAADAAGNIGQSTNAAIYGSKGHDTIVGTAGNDIMTGNKGADTFDFSAAHFGNDVISDFTPHGKHHDVFEFSHTAFANAADVMSHAHQVGHDVVITQDAHDTITLASMNIHQLHSMDFLFV